MPESLRVSYSIDQHDKDGDSFDKCILLHVEHTLIIRLDDLPALDSFINSLKIIRNEIHENAIQEKEK